jgi:hypothetical protein
MIKGGIEEVEGMLEEKMWQLEGSIKGLSAWDFFKQS